MDLFPQKSENEPITSSQRQQLSSVGTVTSGEVLRGQQELHINHGDAIYTLRVTRQGKLILTK
jgi:hemin uptake protein HemP